MSYACGMLGQTLTSSSIDAGDRYMIATAAGEPVKNWGERGFTHRAEYDALRRLTHVYVEDGFTHRAKYDALRRLTHVYVEDGVDEKLVQRLVYGETHADVANNYTKGRLVQHYDQSGVLITDKYDFKGNLETQTRRLAADYENVIDWSDAGHDLSAEDDPEDALTAAASALETETFDHAFAYDALNRPTSIITPDDSETIPTYNEAGLLEAVDVKVRGSSTATPIVTNIDYDAHGRREKITYDNNTETTYQYDELSFRLSHFKTERTTDKVLLQSLAYYYDAVGNIVSTDDSATHEVYFNATTVPDADADYTYDAVYRLIEASGREHESGAGVQRDETGLPIHVVPHANDPSGLRTYTQSYAYDVAGNITAFQHTPTSGSGGFTRAYTYTSGTNRLATTTYLGGTRNYSQDAHGNMAAMPHLSVMDWDFAEQLKHVEVTTGQDVYFVYDASGQRVRKVYVHGQYVDERIYIGGFEIWRRHESGSLKEERETLHVADDARRVCMVETLTVDGGSAPGTITPRFRYQLDNHLGTCCVETDDAGAVISYEEYHPYGTSAYRAMASGVEVSARRYRYTGKERDDETGLYLMGARYYACWLARWTAADPAGTVDGTNLYAYVRGSPVGLVDPSGTFSDPFGAFAAATAESLKKFGAAVAAGVAANDVAAVTAGAPAAATTAATTTGTGVGGGVTIGAAAWAGIGVGTVGLFALSAASVSRFGNPFGQPKTNAAFAVMQHRPEPQPYKPTEIREMTRVPRPKGAPGAPISVGKVTAKPGRPGYLTDTLDASGGRATKAGEGGGPPLFEDPRVTDFTQNPYRSPEAVEGAQRWTDQPVQGRKTDPVTGKKTGLFDFKNPGEAGPGKPAERALEAEIVAEGFEVVATQIDFRVRGLGRRRVDILARKDGKLFAFESKQGKPRTEDQKLKDKRLEEEGGTPVGKNVPPFLIGQENVQFPTIERKPK